MFSLNGVIPGPLELDDTELMHFFDILKPEFYQRYQTIFSVPDDGIQS